MHCATVEDTLALEKQLGYCPPNMVMVAARDQKTGAPTVCKVYPLGGGSSRRRKRAEQDKSPFPTIYWLCCPELKRRIGTLERDGAVREFEELLASEVRYK